MKGKAPFTRPSGSWRSKKRWTETKIKMEGPPYKVVAIEIIAWLAKQVKQRIVS